MARARHIAGLSAHEPFGVAAARSVRTRAAELFDHAESVLDTTDIERVHDMRVASRRLRAVLEIFAPCFPKDTYTAVLRDVKALADALAGRLDLDPERVRLLPAGILVLQALSERLGPLRIASGGLREGVILELTEQGAGEA